MSFLRPDEFIILMDHPTITGELMPVDDLKRLRDAGIQTALFINTRWEAFSPGKYSQPNWGYFDQYLERMRQAGLKCLIALWLEQSLSYPDHWYAVSNTGLQRGVFSPWCKMAQALNNQMLEMVSQQYAGPMVQIISGQCGGGERVLLNTPAYLDPWAIADWRQNHPGNPDHTTPAGAKWLQDTYTDLLTEQRRILLPQHNEIWYQLSRNKATNPRLSCHGCEWVDDYLTAWAAFNPDSINHISFNYFPAEFTGYQAMIRQDMDRWHINEFAGAEYCEGLKAGNGRLAVEHGLRGMLVGPLHPFTCHKAIEPWMVDIIRETHELFLVERLVA